MKRGYITVEAAIVVPIVFGIIAMLLLFSVILHDIVVLRAYNNLRMDYQVIAGQDRLTDGTQNLFILKPIVTEQLSHGFFGDKYTAKMVSEGAIEIAGIPELSLDIVDERSYKVLRPKGYIRLLDFVDDVTDKISISRDIKEAYTEKVKGLEELLTK